MSNVAPHLGKAGAANTDGAAMIGLPRLIDVHSHVVPQTLPSDPTGGRAPWPAMRCESCGRTGTILMGDRPFRELDDRSWDAHRRIADMDVAGVAAQVLSPMPELLSYWIDVEPATQLMRYINASIAEMIALAPDRFFGLGCVPMQAPDRAVREMHRLKSDFGLQGIEVGSNINGTYLGDPAFDPIFAAVEALDLAIFVHALHPLHGSALKPILGPLAGFPSDTGLCVASIIAGGVLERFPKLRIGFSHLGGTIGSMIHRLDYGWTVSGGFSGTLPHPPKHYAQQMFFDSLAYNPAYVAHAAQELAPGRIFLGTDYPYTIMEPDPAALAHIVEERTGDPSIWSSAALHFLGSDAARMI